MLCNHSRIKSSHPSPLVETYSLLLWCLYPKRVRLLKSRSVCWACCRPNSVDVMPCVTIDCSASVLRPQRALNTNAITQGLDQHQASMRSADDRAAVVEARVDGLLSWMTWRTWGRGNPSLTVWFQRDECISVLHCKEGYEETHVQLSFWTRQEEVMQLRLLHPTLLFPTVHLSKNRLWNKP